MPSPVPALTQSIDDIWRQAAKQQQQRATLTAVKLQHGITQSLEASVYAELHADCSRYQQTVMTALALNVSTSSWLTVVPVTREPGYRLTDEHYRLAVRHRMGMLPYDTIREDRCLDCAASYTVDAPRLLADPDHFHSCVHQRGVSVTQRHDGVARVLVQLAREAGYSTEWQPTFPPLVEHVVVADPVTGQLRSVRRVVPGADSPRGTELEGDLLLRRHNVTIWVDVRVTRPTKRTLLDSRSKAVHVTAATEGEREKHALHDAGCLRQGWQNTPFVMETYGAYGSDATKLLATMAEHAVDRTPGDFLAHARGLLSVALQSGNARVAALGTQELHTRTYRRMCGGPSGDDLPHHSAGSGSGLTRMQQRRRAQAQAQDATQSGEVDFTCVSHSGYHTAYLGARPASLQLQRAGRAA